MFDTVGDDVSVTWKTDNKAIDDQGVVTQPLFGSGDNPGEFHAILTRGEAEAIVSFSLIVSQEPPDNAEAVAADALIITADFIRGSNESLDRIVSNLTLPTIGKNKTTITWESTATGLTTAGVVSREPFSGVHSKGTLKATVKRDKYSKVVEFDVKVLRFTTKLMITEIYPGYNAEDGWVEIHNTTDEPINLSTVSVRGLEYIGPADIQEASEVLPGVVIPAKGYLILHSANVSAGPGQLGNGQSDVFLSKVFVFQGQFFELLEGGKTLDFVRWQKEGFSNAYLPTTGVFEGNAANPSRLEGDLDGPPGGSTLGRNYRLDDGDESIDWVFFTLGSPGGPNGLATPEGTDTDGDGLSDQYETEISKTDPTKADTDGDSFTDGQEVLEAGLAGINLKGLGADPLVRDVFVEIDYMEDPQGAADNLTDSTLSKFSLALREAALDKVKAV